MKLNKNGWGFKEMLFMTGILLILLLIATYYIYVLYNNLDASNAKQYLNLEAKLQVAAIKYNSNSSMDSGSVSLRELNNLGYIDDFKDANNNDCNGYVIYDNDDYESYIRCNNYTSKNYNKIFE